MKRNRKKNKTKKQRNGVSTLSPAEIDGMRAAGRLASEILDRVAEQIQPGTSTADGLAEAEETEVAAVAPGKGNFQLNDGAIQQVKSGKASVGSTGHRNAHRALKRWRSSMW